MSKIRKIYYNKEKKILIFFQSIVEITSIIEILRHYSFGQCVLVITGGEHFISVIKKLKIEGIFGVKVFRFHALSLKNPINLIKMYFNVYHGSESYQLSNYTFKKTFFFYE
jgi:hypothetical protein